MSWIRVDIALPTHWKSLELADDLGEERAWAYLVQLWAWCHTNARDGRIPGRNPHRQVEQAAGWRGEAGRLARALLGVGFIDEVEGGGIVVHQWEQHNGKHIAQAEESADRVRNWRKGKSETRNERVSNSDVTRNERVPNEGETRNERSNGTVRDETVREAEAGGAGAPPAPADPAPVRGSSPEASPAAPAPQLELTPAAQPAPQKPDPDQVVYDRWRELWAPRAAPVLDEKRRKLIRARRKEGRTQEQLLASLEGWKHDPWADRPQHAALHQLLRDAGQVDKGLQLLASARPAPAPAEPPPPGQACCVCGRLATGMLGAVEYPACPLDLGAWVRDGHPEPGPWVAARKGGG